MKRVILSLCCIVLLVCTFTACSDQEISTATVVDFDTAEIEEIAVGMYTASSERKTRYYVFLEYNNGIVKYCVPMFLYENLKLGDEIKVTRKSNFSEHGYIYHIDDTQIEYCCTLKAWEKTPHCNDIESGEKDENAQKKS